MELDHEVFYRALQARDARFDGTFYVGVTSTRIYCRPICPARTPRRDRCRFFLYPAQAEQQNFRPCLRCRPELAPGRAPVDLPSQTAWATAQQIKSGALSQGGSLEDLAANMGLSSRHLRRIVKSELGVTPVELAQTQRLLLAKQLLTETALSVTEVAFASGFQSLRRLNALFQSKYSMNPTDLRKRTTFPPNTRLNLTLAYRPPLAWDALLDFLDKHALAGVEKVEETCYSRTLAIGSHQGWVRVRRVREGRLLAEVSDGLLPVLPLVLGKLRALFDLDANPSTIEAHLSLDPRFKASLARSQGVRVPGTVDGFELAWRTVLGQQISVSGATKLASRTARELGTPVTTPVDGLDRLSPTAEQFLAAEQPTLGQLGWLRSRSRAAHDLALAFSERRLDVRPGGNPEQVIAELIKIAGIGPWTASYIAMRGLSWSDGWPHGDAVLKKRLGGAGLSDPAWRPWSAYAAMHLWYSPEFSGASTEIKQKDNGPRRKK